MTEMRLPLTAAVVVTYGSRMRLAVQAASAAIGAGARIVVLVTNGYSGADVAAMSDALCGFGDQIVVVPLEANLGSARGFGCGISTALGVDGVEFIWLLDDDNVVQPDALTALATALDDSPSVARSPLTAWVSFRPARPYQRTLARTGEQSHSYPHPASFLYFDLMQFLARTARHLVGRGGGDPVRRPRATPSMLYGPYGGLFAHKDVFRAIGLPDPDLVLYEDDTEYTARLAARGISLCLVPASLILDDEPAGDKPPRLGPMRLLLATSETRVFYAVRNRRYFELRHYGRSVRSTVNGALYTVALAAMSAPPSRWPRLRLVLQAINDGRVGRLGVNPRYPLP